MSKIILLHGTLNKVIVSTYGCGEDKHDYGLHDLPVKKVGEA